ncbi:GCN5-related N-acetyltransferase [Kribbella flavida DSM 17836]|uniref:GCN5-related N-acetyltransferase n=1 Tax=Kribbella flavida (strain DSM 17836 / JCM 10339 / NBRC 14399) TaxID=479435 RepID=D2PL66_KRIFD|nr:GCN5-related N-acetyltransferase [Kribbella flavida DSM 17836]
MRGDFEDVEIALAEVTGVWESEGASGAVAVDGGELRGYLLGAPKGAVWGPNVWVESAGVAALEAETVRDLYAAAAARWVDEGRTAHYVLVPNDAALVDAWFRLGFGAQHAHGIRDLPEPAKPRTELVIRRAERKDIPVLAELDLALPQHQGLSPVFSAGVVPTVQEAVADWQQSIDDPEFATFVAEDNGQVIGSAIGCSLEKSSTHQGLARPDNAGFLGFAAVLPAARGRGAGRALGETVLQWCREAGYDSVVTDWRVTNLLSSRTWPRLGFEQSFLRMHRLIGY